MGSMTNFKLPNSNEVEISQHTQYPWDGMVKINVNPVNKVRFEINLRIPGWARNQPVPSDLYIYLSPGNDAFSIKVNGLEAEYKTENGYAIIDREWKSGDIIEYVLPMNIQRVIANNNVVEDRRMIALERGPIVYCLEGIDNDDQVDNFILADDTKLLTADGTGLFNGVKLIIGKGRGTSQRAPTFEFTAIPYFLWNNRGITKMEVWIPRNVDQ
jgi:DUF1680 family protein